VYQHQNAIFHRLILVVIWIVLSVSTPEYDVYRLVVVSWTFVSVLVWTPDCNF
jgi:hypothetical protein